MNKKYVKWSLLIPLFYSILLFINFKIGSTEGEFKMRPYGLFSELISSIIFVIITILGILNLKYFFNGAVKNAINIAMVIFNTIYFILSFAMMGSALFGLLLMTLLTMSGLIIPYIIVYIIQIFRYISIISEDNDE